MRKLLRQAGPVYSAMPIARAPEPPAAETQQQEQQQQEEEVQGQPPPPLPSKTQQTRYAPISRLPPNIYSQIAPTGTQQRAPAAFATGTSSTGQETQQQQSTSLYSALPVPPQQQKDTVYSPIPISQRSSSSTVYGPIAKRGEGPVLQGDHAQDTALADSMRQDADLLAAQVTEWDSARAIYSSHAQPLLRSFDQELRQLAQKYQRELADILAEQQFEPEVVRVVLDEEAHRIAAACGNVFGGCDAAGIAVLEREITGRRGVLALSKHLPKIQALVRGWLARKHYGAELKRRIRRRKIVAEMLETEEVYVRRLQMLVDDILVPLRARNAQAGRNKPILTPQELGVVFSNIELILQVNRELRDDLKKIVSNWDGSRSRVGGAFLQIAPYLKTYVTFVNNFDAAQQAAINLCKEKPEFARFIATVLEANPEARSMGSSLPTFQILPVQRVPRYVLLLRDLIKCTDEQHVDFADLRLAMKQVKGVAQRINESQASAENLARILEVQTKLGLDNLVQPHRRLLKEGELFRDRDDGTAKTLRQTFRQTVRGGTNLGQSFLWLFSDMMVIAHHVGLKDLVGSALSLGEGWEYKYKATVQLRNAVAKMDLVRPNVFLVIDEGNNSATYRFVAQTAQDASNWQETISRAIDQFNLNKSGLILMRERAASRTTASSQRFPSPPRRSVISQSSAEPSFPELPASLRNRTVTPAQSRDTQRKPSPQPAEAQAALAAATSTSDDDDDMEIPDFVPDFDDGSVAPHNDNLSSNEPNLDAAAEPSRALPLLAGQTLKSKSRITLSDALESMDAVIHLERELFELPIKIEELIPGVLETTAATTVAELHSRFEALRAQLSALNRAGDLIGEALAREGALLNLSDTLQRGQELIAAVRDQASALPSPQNQQIRTSCAFVLRWYLDLYEAWEEFLQSSR